MKIYSGNLLEFLFFVSLGGTSYYFLEIIFRGNSHYSMVLCGGLAFYAVSLINRNFEHTLTLPSRMILAAIAITAIELAFGLYFNVHLHKNVWDYSTQAIQYKGQICLSFSVMWFFLSLPLFYAEKQIRLGLFGADRT